MQLFRHHGFLRPDECQLVRHAMDAGTVEAAEVLVRGARRQPRVRNASLVEPGRHVISQIESRLEGCRELVAESLHLELGEREGPGFIRYPVGGYYRAHIDCGVDPRWPDALRRAASMVIFLNSAGPGGGGEFDGGFLTLFPPDEVITVRPEAGLLVAFPSDVLHEVTPVESGTRDTIVDWFYGSG
jgi:predicted 2-oxoglutarate/Fe(II)-dependent dioxygenase YbiX